MMQLNPQVLQRVRDAQAHAPLSELFTALETGANLFGLAGAQMVLDFQRPEDTPGENDLIPVMILALRPASPPAPPAAT